MNLSAILNRDEASMVQSQYSSLPTLTMSSNRAGSALAA